jgi:hypothetical protein
MTWRMGGQTYEYEVYPKGIEGCETNDSLTIENLNTLCKPPETRNVRNYITEVLVTFLTDIVTSFSMYLL